MAKYKPSVYRIGPIDSVPPRDQLLPHTYHIPTKDVRLGYELEFEDNYSCKEVIVTKSSSEICVTHLDYTGFTDSIPGSDYPSTCWDCMTSPLTSHSCNIIGLTDDNESGIGEVDYESDLFETGLEREDYEEITEALNDKLFISPTSSNETRLLSRQGSTQSYDSLMYTTSIRLPSPTHGDCTRKIPFFNQSMFFKFPPTINFPLPNEYIENIPTNIVTQLKWRPSTITPQVIKSCIAKAGFRMSTSKDWIGYYGKHMKAATFKTIKPFQKVNHLPGSFHMGRKDTMWKSIIRMQSKFSKKEFDFVPQTFILPEEFDALKHEYESKGSKARWIMKPPASARGIGVQMVKKFNLIPRNRPLLVQQYISNPMLINDSKCDLRIYVYVTSMDPLRLYIYDDGLVRFATVKYSTATRHLSNRFVHLTNYSVNKKNKNFQANADETVRQGHKWGLKALWPYLNERGVDAEKVWRDIKELVLKTIIASDGYINSQIKANMRHKDCVFELFGFDVMLDDKFKPWLIEVNISPSLHSTSGLDLNIKGPMLCHVLNLTGFRLPDQHWNRVPLTNDEKSKHAHFVSICSHEETSYMNCILDTLTPDDMRMIIETEDELTRRGNFQLVFPISQTIPFLRYFSIPRYYNLLLHAWFANPHYRAGRGIAMLKDFARQGLPFKTQPPLAHVWTHRQKSIVILSPKKYKLPTLTGNKVRKKKVPKLK